MGVSRSRPNLLVEIDELVLDGSLPDAVELPASVAAEVSAALENRGLASATAASVSAAIGDKVARSVGS